MTATLLRWSPLVLAALFATGCGDDSNDNVVLPPASNGKLTLSVTDAPVDGVKKVVVVFSGAVLKPVGSPEIDQTIPDKTMDLLTLQNGSTSDLLKDLDVPSGSYEYIRLKVSAADDSRKDSYVELNEGGTRELVIPSGSETGLKLSGGVTVPANGTANLVVDFDLRKSLRKPEGNSDDYLLKPTLRLVDTSKTGQITGTVAAFLVSGADCAPATVYVFSGKDSKAEDVQEKSSDPITTVNVLQNPTTKSFEYTAAFLPAGEYTAAFTCNARFDNADSDEDVIFIQNQNATVTAGQSTTINFQ